MDHGHQSSSGSARFSIVFKPVPLVAPGPLANGGEEDNLDFDNSARCDDEDLVIDNSVSLDGGGLGVLSVGSSCRESGSPLREPCSKKAKTALDDDQETCCKDHDPWHSGSADPWGGLSRPACPALPVVRERDAFDDYFDHMVAQGTMSQEVREKVEQMSLQPQQAMVKELCSSTGLDYEFLCTEVSTNKFVDMIDCMGEDIRPLVGLLQSSGCNDDNALMLRCIALAGDLVEWLKEIPSKVPRIRLQMMADCVEERCDAFIERRDARMTDIQLLIKSKCKQQTDASE